MLKIKSATRGHLKLSSLATICECSGLPLMWLWGNGHFRALQMRKENRCNTCGGAQPTNSKTSKATSRNLSYICSQTCKTRYVQG